MNGISMHYLKTIRRYAITGLLLLTACGGGTASVSNINNVEQATGDKYVIGAGDGLQVFVWGYDELSTTVQVRPDGNISTPLVEDLQAAGRTPTELARAVEVALQEYVRSPTVTIIVQQFVGEYDRQIRVVGQATEPMSLNYRAGMTLLDVMIEVGGLSEFASGNKAKIVRKENGREVVINVRIKDLLNKGDMSQNMKMQPGDVLIIPESVF
jgi:polysaccharide biosynthesis/export protein